MDLSGERPLPVAALAGNGVQPARRRGATRCSRGVQVEGRRANNDQGAAQGGAPMSGRRRGSTVGIWPATCGGKTRREGQWIGTEAGAALRLFVFDARATPSSVVIALPR